MKKEDITISPMAQKRIIGVVLGVAIVVLSVLVCWQSVGRILLNKSGSILTIDTNATKNPEIGSGGAGAVPVLDTIDSIVESIAVDVVDASVLDDEEAASLNEVNQDSASVNNLGTAYDENSDDNREAFCDRFAESANQITTNMAERRGKLDERQRNREDQMNSGRDSRDGALQDSRSNADEKRSALYAALEAKATTDVQKAAVVTFQETVEKAIDTRRSVLDGVIATFRKGVDTALLGRKDAMQSDAQTFETAVRSALAQTQSGCASGADLTTVRSIFRLAMSSARTTLQTGQTDSERADVQVRILAEARRVIAKKSGIDFGTALKAATMKLQEALGEKEGR